MARVELTNSAVYSVAFTPDGNTVAAAGSDGMIRLFNATNGAIIKEFASVPLTKGAIVRTAPTWGGGSLKRSHPRPRPRRCPRACGSRLCEIQPAELRFGSRNDYAQLLVTARLNSGETADVTRMANFSVKPAVAEVSPTGSDNAAEGRLRQSGGFVGGQIG